MNTMHRFVAAVLLAASAGALADAAPAAPPALVHLGDSLDLDAQQAQAWQNVLLSAGQARQAAQEELRSLAASARYELAKPDADLPELVRLQNRAGQHVLEARGRARQAFLEFYAQATPQQQAAMRQFLLGRIDRAQRLQSLVTTLGLGE